MKSKSPFRVGQPARGATIVGRDPEIGQVEKALSKRGRRLLLRGGRQVGTSSILLEAQARLRSSGRPAIVVRLQSATGVADMGTRVLQAASRQLRKTWKDVSQELVDRLGTLAGMEERSGNGRTAPQLDRALRAAPVEAQREALGAVLDALNAVAGDRKTTIGIALDDVQEIQRHGGVDAEWHLRGVLGRHEHLGYVLTVAEAPHTIALLDQDRAFHGVFEVLDVGALPTKELGAWIDSRLKVGGAKTKRGLGRDIAKLVGPATGDVIRLADRVFWRGTQGGKLRRRDLPAAVDAIVDELDELLRGEWGQLTARQQNLMRALAAGELQPFAERVRRRYDLRSSAAVARTLELLIQKGVVHKSESGYRVVNPYRRRWIEREALPDLAEAAE